MLFKSVGEDGSTIMIVLHTFDLGLVSSGLLFLFFQNQYSNVMQSERDRALSFNTVISHLESFSPVAISSPHSSSFEDDHLYSHAECIKNGHNYMQISFDTEPDSLETTESIAYSSEGQKLIKSNRESNTYSSHLLSDKTLSGSPQSTEESSSMYSTESSLIESSREETIAMGLDEETLHLYNIFTDADKTVTVDLVDTDLTEEQSKILEEKLNVIRNTHLLERTSFDNMNEYDRKCNHNCCLLFISQLFEENNDFYRSKTFVFSVSETGSLTTDQHLAVSSTDETSSVVSSSESLSASSTISIDSYSSHNCANIKKIFSRKRQIQYSESLKLLHKGEKPTKLSRKPKPKLPIQRTSSLLLSSSKKSCKEKSQIHATNLRPQTPHMRSYIALRQQCRVNDSQITKSSSSSAASKRTSHKTIKRTTTRKVKPGICVNSSVKTLDSPSKSDNNTSDENNLSSELIKFIKTRLENSDSSSSKESLENSLPEKKVFSGIILSGSTNHIFKRKRSKEKVWKRVSNSKLYHDQSSEQVCFLSSHLLNYLEISRSINGQSRISESGRYMCRRRPL